LVDEFQDTNYAQLQLIKLLAPPQENPHLTVVGDDDQAIYAFRGSSVHNILEFKTEYPNAGEILLTTNYRSGQPILKLCLRNHHVLNNPDRLEEILKIDKRSGSGKRQEIF
jgi:DNA helicase II / ATP-dependent DNA helicase PcrA